MQCSTVAGVAGAAGLPELNHFCCSMTLLLSVPFGDQGLTEAEAGLSPDSDTFASQHFSFTAMQSSAEVSSLLGHDHAEDNRPCKAISTGVALSNKGACRHSRGFRRAMACQVTLKPVLADRQWAPF